MAKRDVWVRVGDELVRGDQVVGLTVHIPSHVYGNAHLLLKATGHRKSLAIDTGVFFARDDDESLEDREQISALAKAFVDSMARAAAFPQGGLIELLPASRGDREAAVWSVTRLGEDEAPLPQSAV